MQQPWVSVAKKPMTRPKQWNRGGEQDTVSSGVSSMASPTNKPLLSMLLENRESNDSANDMEGRTYMWLSMAALGLPVVPGLALVNCTCSQ